MRVFTMLLATLVALFVAIAFALPTEPADEVPAIINNDPKSSIPIDQLGFDIGVDFMGREINPDLANSTEWAKMAKKESLTCNPSGIQIASRDAFIDGIKFLKKHGDKTSLEDGRCKWANCASPGAAIWWCNIAGKEIKNSHKTIAKKAQKVVDSCKDEGTDSLGNKALSGILEVNGIWKVMLMRDSKLC
ncbi:hypothetical protein BJX68DRAFT_272008 [Aspergillus pseudodeflectus]|uniref:Secreted protein n=1 Tax=Aspergillus pseudodeflectus TaxID=176178 RepID=A0ABR4JI03_9EURO